MIFTIKAQLLVEYAPFLDIPIFPLMLGWAGHGRAP